MFKFVHVCTNTCIRIFMHTCIHVYNASSHFADNLLPSDSCRITRASASTTRKTTAAVDKSASKVVLKSQGVDENDEKNYDESDDA